MASATVGISDKVGVGGIRVVWTHFLFYMENISASYYPVPCIILGKVSPAFLHANSTSHTWPFSAIAELIDNAYDPDVGATEIWIDHRVINNEDSLCFVDNGNGLNQEKLYKMLSFGYCEKVQVGTVKPIGYYGNGFKSGSMRLGKDALVFTRCTVSTSVGLLSQTYLKAINAECVLVPTVTWDLPSYNRQKTPETDANLQAILTYSLFKSEIDLFNTLKSLENMKTGTTIIIYNLKKDKDGTHELDFTSDPHDIRNPETSVIDLTTINRPVVIASHEHRRSLREYCSILYLKPRMKIVLRGEKIKSKFISKSLSQTEKDVYKPGWLSHPVQLTFGFTNSTDPDNYGLMMYHKNRLIRAYEKIGCQTKANDHGVGVVGVVEVNFLEPIHNKQDFNRTDKYTAFMNNASIKLNDYYYEKSKTLNPDQPDLNMSQLPDWTWAQCDNCLQWRRLPTGYMESLPNKWYCRLNPDAAFNRCDIPEEPEDDDEALQATYRKTYKKAQEEKRKKTKAEEEKKKKEKEMMLHNKEILLRKKEQELKRQTEELAEVSSSQDKVDRKPTLADLHHAKQSLKESQAKLLDQQETIRKLETQKKVIEEQKSAMLRMADNIKLTNDHSQSLAAKVKNMAGTSNSTVSSSSSSLHAPKRKGEITAEIQAVKIKKEKLDAFTSSMAKGLIDLTSDDEDSQPTAGAPASPTAPSPTSDKSARRSDKSASGSDESASKSGKVVRESDKSASGSDKAARGSDKSVRSLDKPSSGSESDKLTKGGKRKHTGSTENYEEMEVDIKPEKSSLDPVPESEVRTKSGTVSKSGEEVKDEKDEKSKMDPDKVFVQKSCQTVPTIVKFVSPEEVDMLKLSAVDTKNMLLEKCRELNDVKTKMTSLQGNIWELLKIIVPDFDYGKPENIENIILDFIRVNGEQSESSQET